MAVERPSYGSRIVAVTNACLFTTSSTMTSLSWMSTSMRDFESRGRGSVSRVLPSILRIWSRDRSTSLRRSEDVNNALNLSNKQNKQLQFLWYVEYKQNRTTWSLGERKPSPRCWSRKILNVETTIRWNGKNSVKNSRPWPGSKPESNDSLPVLKTFHASKQFHKNLPTSSRVISKMC